MEPRVLLLLCVFCDLQPACSGDSSCIWKIDHPGFSFFCETEPLALKTKTVAAQPGGENEVGRVAGCKVSITFSVEWKATFQGLRMGIPGGAGICYGHVSVIKGEHAACVACVHIVSIRYVLHASIHICIHRQDIHPRVYAHIHLVSVLKRVIPCRGKPAHPQPPRTQWRLWEDVDSGPSDKPGASPPNHVG